VTVELLGTVFAATAVAALIQLRHLRASNQLDAMLSIMQVWYEPKLQEHLAYVRSGLQRKLQAEDYLGDLRADIAQGRPVSRAEHPEFFVLDL
jgi:hypothetical protein